MVVQRSPKPLVRVRFLPPLLEKIDGPIVYRLGHLVLIQERGVRFPLGLQFNKDFKGFQRNSYMSEKRFLPKTPESSKEELKEEVLPQRNFTLEDYEKAKQELERVQEFGFRSNNPNAGRTRIEEAARNLREIETVLKHSGILEKTEGEKLTEKLDQLFPNAKSRTIIEHEGQKYQIRYFPRESSRSGKTVYDWTHLWYKLSEEEVKKEEKKKLSYRPGRWRR